MRKRIFILLILVMLTSLFSEESYKRPARHNSKPLVGLGLGLLLQVSMHSEFNNNYMCLRHYNIGIPNGETYILETAVLYGRTHNFNTRLKCYIALSGGVSFNHTSLYNRDEYETIEKKSYVGFPIDLSFVRGASRYLGYGFNITVNLNKEKLFGSMFLNLYLGDTKNEDYKPPEYTKIKNDSRFPKANIGPDKIIPREKKASFCYDFNWLNLLLVQAIKNNLILENEKLDWVVPVYYRKSLNGWIYGKYDEMKRIGVKARKYFKKDKGWYYGMGFEYIDFFHKSEDSYHDDYHENLFNFLVSFGNVDYISKRIFIRNQINAAFPIGGDDISINGYGMNSDFMIMDIELLVIGVNFSSLF